MSKLGTAVLDAKEASPALDTPVEYRLSTTEVRDLLALARELDDAQAYPSEAAFYDCAVQHSHRMPQGLRAFLEDFRRGEPSAAALIKGFPVDDLAVGPTPAHWHDVPRFSTTTTEERLLGLVGLALGDPFTWSTLQNGRMIQNVLPIRGEEFQQSGHSSETLLEWHTEDGFHPYRCDYLLLLGIRNIDRVPTTLASVKDVELAPEHAAALFEERFLILPDDEHVRQLATQVSGHPGLSRMQQMREEPPAVAVLFGDPEAPYLRIDPFFMCCADPEDRLAEQALAELADQLEAARQDVVVEAGTLCIIDNFRAVHGRRAFQARYDGKDRWLKKLVVTRDLRKSRDHRTSVTGRVLY
ncbi:guanitoxin biosynthesis L-enduracididine beta-hydroxylase GntD [Micromonospora sp. AKA38]|uniref:guanitoxin biosynthesis L-enduracididine beta-hydroxylase GntD n=1 Tax=Micromonospora sp. AKA38 TaxID=2733861 RepID=UPI0022C8727E|nr:guanitoxin biosynthesis L-enduracididine beta-hydroxylase GntD [Micromonospora sp. AKA38]GHJ15493.1 L-asparagine oxygenase [Micromonospora sp. AKA38]